MWLLMIVNTGQLAPCHFTDSAYKVIRGEITEAEGRRLDRVPIIRKQPETYRRIMQARADHAPESFVWTVTPVDKQAGAPCTYMLLEFEDGTWPGV